MANIGKKILGAFIEIKDDEKKENAKIPEQEMPETKTRLPVDDKFKQYFDKLFREAKQDAGLSHIHFHDSRREAATTMAPKLANVLELAAITGHKSLSMLQVYYKPKAADLAARLDA